MTTTIIKQTQASKKRKDYHSDPEHRLKVLARNKIWRYQNWAKVKEQRRLKLCENRERVRVKLRFRNYGIDESEYSEMLLKQAGKCAICGRDMRVPRVDHCHKTGAVRALLCNRCNLGLGLFGDSVESLLQAALYVESHRH